MGYPNNCFKNVQNKVLKYVFKCESDWKRKEDESIYFLFHMFEEFWDTVKFCKDEGKNFKENVNGSNKSI